MEQVEVGTDGVLVMWTVNGLTLAQLVDIVRGLRRSIGSPARFTISFALGDVTASILLLGTLSSAVTGALATGQYAWLLHQRIR